MARGTPREVRVDGPLAGFADGFREELGGQGYSPLSAANLLYVMWHLSRWMGACGLAPADLDAGQIAGFLAERRRLGYTCWLSERGLGPMLGFLRGAGAVPCPVLPVPGPEDALLERFRCWLIAERAVSGPTAVLYAASVRPFIAGRVAVLAELTAADVSSFVVARSREAAPGVRDLVPALRALLRWLCLEGVAGAGLDAVVLGRAGRRSSGLPRGLPADQVAALLASCDRDTVTGRRDFAVLTVLARLGLRASEASALQLDDISWRTGELLVRGKDRSRERLPVPADVGEAIAGYLSGGRPPAGGSRQVFLRSRAPHGGLGSGGVKSIMRRACVRAGLPEMGPHRLRHTAGTAILRAGGSLAEASQLLRHRAASTTAIYAKVDDGALRPLARPWPGSG